MLEHNFRAPHFNHPDWNLYVVQRLFLYAVLVKSLCTHKGVELLKRFEQSRDGHSVFIHYRMHMRQSPIARAKIYKMETMIYGHTLMSWAGKPFDSYSLYFKQLFVAHDSACLEHPEYKFLRYKRYRIL